MMPQIVGKLITYTCNVKSNVVDNILLIKEEQESSSIGYCCYTATLNGWNNQRL